MKFKSNNPLHKVVLGGLLASIVFVLTFAVAIHIPVLPGAYFNLGDVGVFLCAFVMGSPWGVIAAAVASSLADILLGSTLYALPTLIIKGAMAFAASFLFKRFNQKKPIALLCSGIIMPIGYFLFEAFLYGPMPALLAMPANLGQFAVCAVLALPIIKLSEKFVSYDNL